MNPVMSSFRTGAREVTYEWSTIHIIRAISITNAERDVRQMTPFDPVHDVSALVEISHYSL